MTTMARRSPLQGLSASLPGQGEASASRADAAPDSVGGRESSLFSPSRDPEGLLSRRTELVLRELDALPTLPAIATRLIQLGSQEDVEIREIVRLIEIDPALTVKLLSLCKKAATRTRYPITTVEMAVVMLGLDAVRALVLSVQVFEWASNTPRRTRLTAPGRGRKTSAHSHAHAESAHAANGTHGAAGSTVGGFDRIGFWQHSIAVACCAELIAREHPEIDVQPEEAFVCGLVHDLGKLALDLVLPKAYARVIELSEMRAGNIADFERPIVGLDHHTAGLRLAERWGLPTLLRDAMGYHALSAGELAGAAEVESRAVVGIVGIADALCRKLSLGWSGNHAPVDDARLEALAECVGLNWGRIENALPRLYEATSSRCKDLGLGDEPSQRLLIESILRANARLGRLNQDLAEANRALEESQARLCEARAMACLGEMTAGAAHEMNTPLAVISGRAQTLLKRANAGEGGAEQDRAAAQAIVDGATRLNALIHRLHRIASPPKPSPATADVKAVLEQVIARAKAKADQTRASAAGGTGAGPTTRGGAVGGALGVQGIKLTVAEGLGAAKLDRELFADALVEIVVNAIESGPKGCIEVRAFSDDETDQLVVQVVDDGRGMSEHALAHATDPFFSDKPAGRQAGLGLALAHRLLQSQHAALQMSSRSGRGTTVSVRVDAWRA